MPLNLLRKWFTLRKCYLGGLTLSDKWIEGGVGGKWEEREEGRERELRLVCEIKRIFLKKKMLSIGVRMFDKFLW